MWLCHQSPMLCCPSTSTDVANHVVMWSPHPCWHASAIWPPAIFIVVQFIRIYVGICTLLFIRQQFIVAHPNDYLCWHVSAPHMLACVCHLTANNLLLRILQMKSCSWFTFGILPLFDSQHFVVAHIHIALTYAGICLRLNANNILFAYSIEWIAGTYAIWPPTCYCCAYPYWTNFRWHVCHLNANMLLLCISILNEFPLACLPFDRQQVIVAQRYWWLSSWTKPTYLSIFPCLWLKYLLIFFDLSNWPPTIYLLRILTYDKC